MTKEDKLIISQARLSRYNQLANQIRPWVIKYHKALNEIWGKPIDYNRDRQILVNYGLCVWNKYNDRGWDWCWEVKQLDNQLKLSL